MSEADHYRREKDSYRWRTLQSVNALLFVAPMLVAFHVGSAVIDAPLAAQDNLGLFATRDLERILGVFGSTAPYLPPLLVGAALLVQHAARRDRWRLDATVFVGMVVESVIWALPLLALNYLCGRLLNTGGSILAAGDSPQLVNVLKALGAGVYEEFVFRLVGLGLLTWIIVNVFSVRKRRDWVVLFAIVASSLAFSLYHFSAGGRAMTPEFNAGDFTWRAAAGLCLALAYVTRGFGVAVGAHVVWDLYVILIAGA